MARLRIVDDSFVAEARAALAAAERNEEARRARRLAEHRERQREPGSVTERLMREDRAMLADHYPLSDGCCSCHIAPPCAWCIEQSREDAS